MPSIAQAAQALQDKKESGGLMPVENCPVIIPTAPIPEFPPKLNSTVPLRTPMPATTVLQPDTQRTFHSAASPQVRVPPMPPNSNPNVGAAAASQSITVV